MNKKYGLDLYIKKMQNRGIRLHSALLYSDYAVQEAHYFTPYDAQTRHRAYSTTKSFVAIAVGKLYTEGRINLDDPQYADDEYLLFRIHLWSAQKGLGAFLL